MAMDQGLSIIIPTQGKRGQLFQLLSSIEFQKVDFPLEVIICDNSLTAKTQAEISAFVQNYKLSTKHLIMTSNGVNRARNQGTSVSQFSICLFVDDDCWFKDQLLLQKHLRFHQSDESLFAVGGDYQLAAEANFFDKCYHFIQMKWLYSGRILASKNDTTHLVGGHFSVKKNFLIEKNLLFDEGINYGGSELSFFAQARRLGLTMSLENLSVVHQTRETFFSLTKKLYLQGKGKATVQRYAGVTAKSEEILSKAHDNSLSFLTQLMERYLAVVFWYGFYKNNKNIFGFLKYIIKNIEKSLAEVRNKLLAKSDAEIKKKIARGDRL